MRLLSQISPFCYWKKYCNISLWKEHSYFFMTPKNLSWMRYCLKSNLLTNDKAWIKSFALRFSSIALKMIGLGDIFTKNEHEVRSGQLNLVVSFISILCTVLEQWLENSRNVLLEWRGNWHCMVNWQLISLCWRKVSIIPKNNSKKEDGNIEQIYLKLPLPFAQIEISLFLPIEIADY